MCQNVPGPRMFGLLSYLFLLTQGDLRLICCFLVVYRMPIWLVYLCHDPLIFPSIPHASVSTLQNSRPNPDTSEKPGKKYTLLRKPMNETIERVNSDIFANPEKGLSSVRTRQGPSRVLVVLPTHPVRDNKVCTGWYEKEGKVLVMGVLR